MERFTYRDENGYWASEKTPEELLAELARYEDFVESIDAELELSRRNLADLKASGRARSATYTMLTGTRFMLEEMQKRIAEPAKDTSARLAYMRKLLEEDQAVPGDNASLRGGS